MTKKTVEIILNQLTPKMVKYVEGAELEYALMRTDSLQDKKIDILLVQRFDAILKYFGTVIIPYTNGSWRWQYDTIATGKYPLEKLPDHVRDLAKTLYYN